MVSKEKLLWTLVAVPKEKEKTNHSKKHKLGNGVEPSSLSDTGIPKPKIYLDSKIR